MSKYPIHSWQANIFLPKEIFLDTMVGMERAEIKLCDQRAATEFFIGYFRIQSP